MLARSAFARSSNSLSTFTGRLTRSIALFARSSTRALPTRQRRDPNRQDALGSAVLGARQETWRRHREMLDAHHAFP